VLHFGERPTELGDVLAPFSQEEIDVLGQVHGIFRLMRCYQPSTRWTASSTRLGWNGFTTKSLAPA
jgi:hypothetical protein